MDAGLTLTTNMALVFALLAFTVLMLVLEWIRADLVALLVIVVIGITRLLPVDQLFDGFAGNAVISLIAVMIMGAGLDRTGVLNKAASFILRLAGGVESRVSLLVNAMVGSMSSVIQSQALSALFLPVVSRVSARTGLPLKRLLLPMACMILCGTNTTMISNSPLILLNDLIVSANRNLPPGAQTIQTFTLFAIAPVGVPLLLGGLAYFALFTRRLLPGDEERQKVTPGRTETYFAETYGIDGEVFELTVTTDSPLVGMSVAEVEQLRGAPLILALKTGSEARLAPPADQMIWVGSVLGVLGKREAVADFANVQLCQVQSRLRNFADLFNPARAGISEVVIPPNSTWIKKTVGELRLRKTYAISVLAVNRGEQVFREDVRQVALRPGDTLVLHSFWRDLAQTAESRDFVVVTDYPKEEHRPSKIWHAATFFAIAMGLGLFTDLRLSIAMLVGAVGMLLTGVLDMDEAYGAINWKTIFTLACLIPLGAAMDSTGAAAWIAQEVLKYLGGWPQWGLQAVVAVLTLLIAQVVSNVGATVMMVPMAINVALASGGNPALYALVVAVSTSNAFILPSANPVIMIVSGPGGYRARDFLRVGIPLTVLMLVILLASVNFWFDRA
ncbi:SLC13 family permease [Dokdonella fugitiva]|jgi:di/tricarboxylate transporter|uniref:TrkA family protein n=1 Tax=Dokdonella fugitiva TaxID=328517 RepID=A0A4R2IJD2_9GAMM|nr:SLC13 family permease [Dokdonella fugitiva]MBA8882377.1 di/tricarboxylate transporter [Dokdonella fugitiva]TCO42825.1 TrkA family protein [Dokdonella fugitiva]